MTAKQEAEKLMNNLLPVAQSMLSECREFYPYGGYGREPVLCKGDQEGRCVLPFGC